MVLVSPSMLGGDCIYSTGPIVAKGNQEGRAEERMHHTWLKSKLKQTFHLPKPINTQTKSLQFLFLGGSQESLEDAAFLRVSRQNQVH